MALLLPAVSIIVGMVLLVAGAEALVRGAASVAKRMAIPEIVVGLTIVALGTSAPELVVNIFAAASNQHSIVIGSITGSNLANILLILGVSGLVRPLSVQKNTVWKEIPFVLLATLVVFLLAYDSWDGSDAANRFSRNDGLVLLGLFAIFITYTFGLSRVESSNEFEVAAYSGRKSALMMGGGMVGLSLGGWLTVDGAVDIASQLGVSEKLIACTIIAGGTSLPELATSVVAASKGRCDIAVGNVVGSCIFNLLMVLGLSAVVSPLSYSSAFDVDAIVLVAATIVLFLTMFTGKRRTLDRWEAAMMLAGYVAYIGYLLHEQ